MTGCALARFGGCQGRLDPHHILKQQHIRSKFRHGGVWVDGKLEPLGRTAMVNPEVTLRELLDSPANLTQLCRFHHSQHHGASGVHLEPSGAAQAFAAELGLLHVFEKTAERRAA